ncbi:MAG: hypothetical protein IJ382_02455 [Flavobacteriales bacterium]|nr:hypothetical protein [Flavobacteriales bacterium]
MSKRVKKLILLTLLCVTTIYAAPAASLIEGRIYLKNGSIIECTGNDRLQLPKKSGKLKIFRNAFQKTKTKELISVVDIDSVICWHTKSPEHLRKLVFEQDPGWMWVYVETPHITACIYSKKGYSIDTNGGMLVLQRHGWFSRSRVGYFLQKCGESGFQNIGSAYHRSKDSFRERIACYIDDDPELAGRIRQSNTYRDKTILMLQEYDPTKH